MENQTRGPGACEGKAGRKPQEKDPEVRIQGVGVRKAHGPASAWPSLTAV